MVALTILTSIALLGVTIALMLYLQRKFNSWYLSLMLLLAFFVPFLSHCWHAIAGEALIAEECEVDGRKVLAWTECISSSDFYTVAFNSYELTVSIENIVLYSIGIYLAARETFFYSVQYWIILLLVSGILSSIALIFLPYEQMKWYTMVYNYYNISMLVVSFLIIYNNLPETQPYTEVTTDTSETA